MEKFYFIFKLDKIPESIYGNSCRDIFTINSLLLFISSIILFVLSRNNPIFLIFTAASLISLASLVINSQKLYMFVLGNYFLNILLSIVFAGFCIQNWIYHPFHFHPESFLFPLGSLIFVLFAYISFCFHKQLVNDLPQALSQERESSEMYEYIPEMKFIFFFKIAKTYSRSKCGEFRNLALIISFLLTFKGIFTISHVYLGWHCATLPLIINSFIFNAFFFFNYFYKNAVLLKILYLGNILLGASLPLVMALERRVSTFIPIIYIISYFKLVWCLYCWYIQMTQIPIAKERTSVENINEMRTPNTSTGYERRYVDYPAKEVLLNN